ncbi:MAG TPA: ATP-binding protein [Stellaceae bacterium]
MVRFRSVTARIIAFHIAAVVVTSICMPVALIYMLRNAANQIEERNFEEQTQDILRYLSRDADGEWRLDLPEPLKDTYSRGYGRYSFAVVDETGRVLFTSLADNVPITRHDPLVSNIYRFARRRGGNDYDGASVPVEVAGQHLWVQVAENMSHRDVLMDDIVAEFFPRVGWITAPILLLLLVIDILIFRRSLRPILDASALAARIGPERTELRLPERSIPREILPLVQAVNAALDRLQKGFKAQREFTADAAHELRTPLAILRTHADMIRDPAVAQALRDDIDGMGRLVNQLLEVAELDSLVIHTDDAADLQAVCVNIAVWLAPLAVARKKSVAVSGVAKPVRMRGNEEALGQAVRNLVENALAHTPPGTTVEIVVTDDPGFDVIDEGPGVPVHERPLIFRRFWRRDRRRAGNAGLGLSIVGRIVAAHGGAITVDSGLNGRGARFAVRFPPDTRLPGAARRQDEAAE